MNRIEINAENLLSRFSEIERQYRIEVASALNTSAFEVRSGWAREIGRVFDNPTPFTLRSPLYKKATVDKLVAEVFIRDADFSSAGVAPATYLMAQAFGGERKQKPSERALERNIGFPKFYIPGKNAPKDRYGNLPGSQIVKILASVQAMNLPENNTPGRKVGRRGRGHKRKFFRIRPGTDSRLSRDIIFERLDGGGVRPILIGVNKAPRYRVRFQAFELARRIFHERFAINMHRAKKKLAAIVARGALG